MDLSFSDEQNMLADMARRYLAEHVPAGAHGDRPDLWPDFCEMGWTGLLVPEVFGGSGQTLIDAGIIASACGKALVAQPLLETVVLGTRLILSLGRADQQQTWLPRLCSGDLRLAVALAEPGCAAPLSVQCRARRQADGWLVTGQKTLVAGAAEAELFLIPARDSETGRVHVFALPATTPGLTLRHGQSVDGRAIAQLDLEGMQAPATALLDAVPDAAAGVQSALDAMLTVMCWEAVGAMEALLETTIDYTKTRRQFGRALAENQVLRHKMVQMKLRMELARAAALHAALADGTPDQSRAASGAKARMASSALFVGETAVQLHGGNGVTEELTVGLYFKRLMALRLQFGGPEHHLARHARLTMGAAA